MKHERQNRFVKGIYFKMKKMLEEMKGILP
jgi:hypothetical protein